jgi:sugar O-acyltransferase (sialic acid O-acetyltransferase NeuD family)
MRRIVIFGCGKIAEEAYYYFTNDSQYEVAAFTVDPPYLIEPTKFGKPVIDFAEVEARFPPSEYAMFVAVGYQDLNQFRADRCARARAMGYRLISYVCSRASNFGRVEIGDNCFILENVVIQPGAKVGHNVFLWSGNHVGHHAAIGDHCYLSGQAIVSGSTIIEPFCYIGVNATIGHDITIGRSSFIGAGTLITKNAPAKSVYIMPETPRYRLDSEAFLKLTKMK